MVVYRKGYRNSKRDLIFGDRGYFKFERSEMKSRWQSFVGGIFKHQIRPSLIYFCGIHYLQFHNWLVLLLILEEFIETGFECILFM